MDPALSVMRPGHHVDRATAGGQTPRRSRGRGATRPSRRSSASVAGRLHHEAVPCVRSDLGRLAAAVTVVVSIVADISFGEFAPALLALAFGSAVGVEMKEAAGRARRRQDIE